MKKQQVEMSFQNKKSSYPDVCQHLMARFGGELGETILPSTLVRSNVVYGSFVGSQSTDVNKVVLSTHGTLHWVMLIG